MPRVTPSPVDKCVFLRAPLFDLADQLPQPELDLVTENDEARVDAEPAAVGHLAVCPVIRKHALQIGQGSDVAFGDQMGLGKVEKLDRLSAFSDCLLFKVVMPRLWKALSYCL